jgi:hypothetical protein
MLWEPGVYECSTGKVRVNPNHKVTWLTGMYTGAVVDVVDWHWSSKNFRQLTRHTPDDPHAEEDY